MGFLVNTVVLCVDLGGEPSFAELFRYLATRGEFASDDLEAELSRSLEDTKREMRYERTRPDGRVIETSDPSHRLALFELQEALDVFREASHVVPEDEAHESHAEAHAAARTAAERCKQAFDEISVVFLGLGVGEEAVAQFLAGSMPLVNAFLVESAPAD